MASIEKVDCETVVDVIHNTNWLKEGEELPSDPFELQEYVLSYLRNRLVGEYYSGVIRPVVDDPDHVVFCLPKHLLDIGGDCEDVRRAVLHILTTQDDEQIISQMFTRDVRFDAAYTRCTVLRNGDVQMFVDAKEFMSGRPGSQFAAFIDQLGLKSDLKKDIEKNNLQFLPSDALNRKVYRREKSHKRPGPVGEPSMRQLFADPLKWQRCVYDFNKGGHPATGESRIVLTFPFADPVSRNTFVDRLREIPCI